MTGTEPDIVASLGRGDRRSTGNSDAVARTVLARPDRLPPLVDALFHADPVVAMRAADALEKICRRHPDWLSPHRPVLLAVTLTTQQPEVQWHLAQILPHIGLEATDRAVAATLFQRWLDSPSRIVRVEALTALVQLGDSDPHLAPRLERLLDLLASDTSPAMRARVRCLRRRKTSAAKT